jgi:hypothetical protein
MYELYCEKAQQDGRDPVKQTKYRQIFCDDYNLSFFKPKKDQCRICTLYEMNKASNTLDEEKEEQYVKLQERKVAWYLVWLLLYSSHGAKLEGGCNSLPVQYQNLCSFINIIYSV